MRTGQVLLLIGTVGFLTCCSNGDDNPPNPPAKQFNVIESNRYHYNGNMSLIGKNGLIWDYTIPAGVIGYDSELNQPAPCNCYNYTIEATAVSGGQTISDTSNTQSTNESLGVSLSVSARYGAFSTKDSASYSQWSSSSSQSVNVGVIAENRVLLRFKDISLKSDPIDYNQMYEEDPALFAATCGNQVLTQMPVHNLLVGDIKFYTHDSAFNRSENASLGASYGLDSVKADVTHSSGGSQGTVNVTVSLNNVGRMSDTTAALTALTKCIDGTGSDCGGALALVSSAAQDASNNALDEIAKNPQSDVWMQYYSPDYTQGGSFRMVDASTYVKNPTSPQTDSAFDKYVKVLTNATNVLSDLQIANYKMGQYGSGIAKALGNTDYKTLLYSGTDLGNKYTARLANNESPQSANYAIPKLQEKIQNCLYAEGSSSSEWQSYCESIDPTKDLDHPELSVAYVILNDADENWISDPPDPEYVDYLKRAYMTSAYAMVYDTKISYAVFFLDLVGVPCNTMGNLVWMPRTDGKFAIIALPDGKQALDPYTRSYYFYFQNAAADEHSYYPPADPNHTMDWFFHNPTESLDFKVPYDEALDPFGTIDKNGNDYMMTEMVNWSSSALTCYPFGPNSSGCWYHDVLDMTYGYYRYEMPGYQKTQVLPDSPAWPAWVNTVLTTEDNYQQGNTPFFFSINPFGP